MKYEQQLLSHFGKTGMTNDQLSNKLGIHRNNAVNKFSSSGVESSIDFLLALGLSIVDKNGVNILTGKLEVNFEVSIVKKIN